MITITNRNIVAFDVDDTLILWDEHSKDLTYPTEGRLVVICPYDGKPYSFLVHQRHVDFLKREKAKGSFIIVWSRSEGAWANAVVKALGMEDYVDISMGKVTKFIDDKCNIPDTIGVHLFLDKDGHSV